MNFVILTQRPFHLRPDRFVVVDNEHFRFHAAWRFKGNITRIVVPAPLACWLQLELFHEAYPWLAFEYFKRVSNKRITVHLGEFGLEAAQGANAANKLVDAVCSFADPPQGVLSEGGIVKVHRQIL